MCEWRKEMKGALLIMKKVTRVVLNLWQSIDEVFIWRGNEQGPFKALFLCQRQATKEHKHICKERCDGHRQQNNVECMWSSFPFLHPSTRHNHFCAFVIHTSTALPAINLWKHKLGIFYCIFIGHMEEAKSEEHVRVSMKHTRERSL